MPEYLYQCPNMHKMTRFFSMKNHLSYLDCDVCGLLSGQIITAPLLVKAQPECRYDSPIDGTPITSWAARRNDLAKHGCQEYDPGMKSDYHQRIKDADEKMDKSVDEFVERKVEKMSGTERGKLWSDLTEKGLTADVTRGTYGG